jgi:hypothetical protein
VKALFTLKLTELLDINKHDREAFCSGVSALDVYIKEQAKKEADRNIAQTFVLTCVEKPSKILGYYSLSSNRIQTDDLPKELSKKLPKYGSVGVTVLGRFAIDEKYQNKHKTNLRLGEHLLTDAKLKSWQVSRVVASYALIVDLLIAEKGDPTGFYKKYDFVPFPDHANKLYLPMTIIEKTLRIAGLIA